jgi:N-acetylmuramoyl-L-alanine amidase
MASAHQNKGVHMKVRSVAVGIVILALVSAGGVFAWDRLSTTAGPGPTVPRVGTVPSPEGPSPTGDPMSPDPGLEQMMAGGGRLGTLLPAPSDGRYVGPIHALLAGDPLRLAIDLETTIDTAKVRTPGTRLFEVAANVPVRLSIHRGSKPVHLHFDAFAERFNGTSARSVRMRERSYWVQVEAGNVTSMGEYGPAYSSNLSPGDVGAAVTALQRRLRDLHYDVGTVDGAFGYDTEHAVVAFKKVNDMPRDDAVDADLWAALYEPAVPKPHRKESGTRVEIDLTRQVLYLIDDKRIVRIVDVSTGGGLQSYADGSHHIASTPTGDFHIFEHIPGWYESSVGPMYESNFFATHIAIHGSGSVPSYPASHGCVRVTVPAMDRLLPELSVGMPVSVYRS